MAKAASPSLPKPDWRDLLIALGIAALGCALFLWRLSDPAKLDFDESHYVPAARTLIAFAGQPNPEHPPLAKLLIGLGLSWFGDTPFGWRIMSVLAGTGLLFSGVMAARWLFASRAAAVMTGILMLSSQTLYILARVAMLDIFMASFAMLAFWMLVATIRSGFHDRFRLPVAGAALGLATACKWTAIPLDLTAFLAVALLYRHTVDPSAKASRMRLVPLREALSWVGPFALLVYLLTFLPYLQLTQDAVTLEGIIPRQFDMLKLQDQPLAPHPYQSQWWQWVLDLRPIWFFYEPVAGVQRGVLYLGNPALCWGGLAALLACLYAGLRQGARALLVPVVLYAAALAFFIVIPKPVQFYYHYFIPTMMLCLASAGALDHYFWSKGRKLVPVLAIGFCVLIFAEFYPIISAAALNDPQDFNRWMWLNSWR